MTWILAAVALSCFVGLFVLFVVIRQYQVVTGRLDRLAAENRRLKAQLAERDGLVTPTGPPTDTPTDTPKWIHHDEVVPLRKPRRVNKEG